MKKDWLARFVVLVVLVVVVLSSVNLSKLNFSFDLERFFPDGDNDLEFYLDFRQEFSPDNDFLFIGIENNSGIFYGKFLKNIQSFTDEVEGLKNVKSVISIANAKKLIIGPFGFSEVPYIHFDDSVKWQKDSIRLFAEEKFQGVLLSNSGKAISVNIITEELLSKKDSDSLLNQLNHLVSKYNFEKVHFGGRIPSQAYVIEKMGSELMLFMSISFLILLIFLYWLYRSFLGVVLPLVIVVFSTVILLGVLVLIGEDINLVITILPVVMFVVGTSDVIHVLSRYSAEKIRLNSWLEALKLTFKEVGLATLLTSITTAIGFGTLITASVYPVQRFGVVMAIGVMIAFCVTFLLLPSILYLIKDRWVIMNGGHGKEVVRIQIKSNWYDAVMNNKSKILISFLVLLILSFAGISSLKVNNFLLDDLRENDPHMLDFKFFENEFAGVRPFELSLESDIGLLDFRVLKELEKVENYLVEHFGAKNIISPLYFMKSINQSVKGGKSDKFHLAASSREFERQLRYVKRIERNEVFQNYTSQDKMRGRLSSNIKDEGRIAVESKISGLQGFIESSINQDLLKVKATGTAMLIDKNAEHLASNMIQGLGIAFVVISIIVAFLFRSLKMVLISLIPNVLPLLLIAGFMGFVGIDLKASTIIIFTISFGIAVDDTIHFLSKLRIEFANGLGVDEALRKTFLSTGKAIVVTSLILFAGFASLMFSTFQSTFYIGLLISLTLFFAVVADLVLLPILVKAVYKD